MHGIQPRADLVAYCSSKNGFAVFDVGETIPRINRRLNADLVTSEHTNPAGWPRGMELQCPFVTLSKRGIEPQWLQTRLYLRARRSFAF